VDQQLISLETLKQKVDTQAARYLPDVIYGEEMQELLHFEVVPFHEVVDDPMEPDALTIRLRQHEKDEGMPHLTTNWSRHQLLQTMGTKEKWFAHVPLETQAQELNCRRHVLHNMVLRTMRGGDEENYPFRVLRGLVSSQYCDIPNTSIMEMLISSLPPKDTYALWRHSGQTDRAFYAYVVIDRPIGISGQLQGYPGLLLKNSEVGFTSLWVIPFLMLPWLGRAAVLEQQTLLRRVHRGRVNDLKELFEDALRRAAPLWKELSDKIPVLGQHVYPDEATAVDAMTSLVFSCGGSKMFAYRCEQDYKSAGHSIHNALVIFETLVKVAGTIINPDDAYVQNAVAGAVLLKLVL
jgi:hypothetical protein